MNQHNIRSKKNIICIIITSFLIITSCTKAQKIPDVKNYDSINRANDLSFASNQLKVLPTISLKHKLWPDDKTIILIHPPKTAGTNLANLMEAIQVVDQNIITKRASVSRIAGVSPNLFVKGSIGGLNTILTNANKFNCKEEHINFISGHMPIVEKQDEVKYFGSCNVSYIGLIRDPIERELSLTNFDYQRGYIEEADTREYILEKTIDNPQTRLYAGESSMDGECNEQTFAKAKANIKNRFTFVAPSNDIEIVMAIIAKYYKKNNVAYAKAQITGLKALSKQDKDIVEKLSNKHHFDILLYQYALEQWNLWKVKNLIVENPLNIDNHQDYLTLMPDFSQTKLPAKLNMDHIIEYNQNQLEEVKIIKQNHKILINQSN